MNLHSIVADRIEELNKLDVEALQSLPAHAKKVLSFKGTIVLSQYHEISESGEHKIVVQAIRDRWLGLSSAIEVDGFVIDRDGIKRPLTDTEKWPYM